MEKECRNLLVGTHAFGGAMLAKKKALVIGNGNYAGSLKLVCPSNDAREMNRALTELGFDVIFGTNLKFHDTHDLVARFLALVADPSTNTSLLYYSGHGVQLSDQNNYMVPIDFNHLGVDNLSQLVSVQDIVDRMIAETAVRIVLIDACRSNADAQDIIQASKGVRTGRQAAKSIGIKQIIVDGRPVRSQGLASMQSTTNTFIAFAAAPGEVAYEGEEGRSLSPFTESLTKYLDVVDLPISNLTSRVRQDVLSRTQNMQRTWDTSSLMAPFYFNPGSLLMFLGNFMALVGLILATITYSLVLLSPGVTWAGIVMAAALPILSLLILLVGMQVVYSRLRGRFDPDGDRPPALSEILVKVCQKGFVGGYLGSLVAAPLLSGIYYASWKEPDVSFGQLLLEITVATALTAGLLGLLTILFARLLFGARGVKFGNEARRLIGAVIGGALAGMVTAPLLTVYFGQKIRAEMTPDLVLPGSIFGASIIIFSIVNFDFERLTGKRIWSSAKASVAALAIGVVASVIVFGPLYLLGIVQSVTDYLTEDYTDVWRLAAGGAIYGLPVGLILGVVIGSAIILTERWSKKPVFV